MTQAQVATLVEVLVPLILALTSYLVYLTHETKSMVKTVDININHRMDELVTATREAAHAAGVVEGQTGVPTTSVTSS